MAFEGYLKDFTTKTLPGQHHSSNREVIEIIKTAATIRIQLGVVCLSVDQRTKSFILSKRNLILVSIASFSTSHCQSKFGLRGDAPARVVITTSQLSKPTRASPRLQLLLSKA